MNVYLARLSAIRDALLRCPGLRPGWFLVGSAETWYPARACGKIMSAFSLITGAAVCRDCSRAFDRRGFRLDYEVVP